MTQMTDEQQDRVEAVAGRTATKLKGFYTKVLDDTGLGDAVVSDISWAWKTGKPPK